MALAYVGATQKTRVTGQLSTTLAITVANANSLIVVNSFVGNAGGSTVTVSDADGSYTAVVANGTAPDAGVRRISITGRIILRAPTRSHSIRQDHRPISSSMPRKLPVPLLLRRSIANPVRW